MTRTWRARQGVFACVNLSGGVLKPDADDNRDVYGREISAHEILVRQNGTRSRGRGAVLRRAQPHSAAR